MDPVTIPAEVEVHSFTRSWDNRGYAQKLGSPWIRPRSFFSQILKGFCSDGPVNKPAKFEVRSFTRSWDNRGYSKKFGPSLDTPTLPFLQHFSRACVRMDPLDIPAKFEVPGFSRSWDNSDCSLEVGLRTPNLGEEEAVGGRWWYRSRERLWLPIGSP